MLPNIFAILDPLRSFLVCFQVILNLIATHTRYPGPLEGVEGPDIHCVSSYDIIKGNCREHYCAKGLVYEATSLHA